MGAAILAMVAGGEYSSVQEAAGQIVKTTAAEEPDLELTKKYEERYQQFRLLYPSLKNVFEKIQ